MTPSMLEHYLETSMTREKVEARAMADYQSVVGRVLRVKSVEGYQGALSTTITGGLIVRVDPTPASDVIRYCDGWLDPYWNVTVLGWSGEGAFPLTSCWISGRSYRLSTTGRVQESPGEEYEVIGTAAEGLPASKVDTRTPLEVLRSLMEYLDAYDCRYSHLRDSAGQFVSLDLSEDIARARVLLAEADKAKEG